jgi:putative transposase
MHPLTIHWPRNKLAELQKKMSKCTKYSCQWKKFNIAKLYILSKAENQLKDYNHKTIKPQNS